jgi:hypothetical protein
MRLCGVFAALVSFAECVKLRNGGILDEMNLDEAPTEKPFVYKPSNSNTRAPKTFSDELIVDDAYHELVPGLQVLNDLTTTTNAPR